MSENSAEALLQVRDVTREYPTPAEPLVVLSGVNFTMARGESMAIMGESGSGKSTLLNILGSLDRATAGEVTLEGVNAQSLDPAALADFRNRKVGFVFQDHHLLPQCTVLENVLVPTLVNRGDGAAAEARAKDLLDRMGLADRMTHRPSEISGGERQRAAIARALINEPLMLLSDEPTGNLDRKTSESIGDLYRELEAERKTIMIIVTHSPDFAALFRRGADLVDGKLRERVTA